MSDPNLQLNGKIFTPASAQPTTEIPMIPELPTLPLKPQKIKWYDRLILWLKSKKVASKATQLIEWIITIFFPEGKVALVIARLTENFAKKFEEIKQRNSQILTNGGTMLKGKKTFILAGLLLVAVLVPIVLKVPVPEAAYAVLAALGLGAVRLALADLSQNQGWKTYAAVGLVILVAVLETIGVKIPYDLLYGFAGVIGLVGIRDAVGKLEQP